MLLIALLLPVFLFSDDAPMQPTQSGNVMPAYNNDIRMKNERIDIYLYRNYYSVEVNYTFVNTGKKQDIIMGFPNIETEYGIYEKPITDFVAYDGNKKMRIFKKDADESFYKVKKYVDLFPSDAENRDLLLKNYDVFFECFETTFDEGETKHIVNKYTQEYFIRYNAYDRYFAYILKSGAFWKGDIENIDVYIHLDRIPESERKDLTIYDVYECFDSSDEADKPIETMTTWKIKPEDTYEFKRDLIEMHFEDVEPDFNIEVTFPMPIISRLSASSVLESKNDRYSPLNLLDNDPKTAWVEGVKGDGIGEDLTIYISDSAGRWTARSVHKLGIVSGYAKSKDIFYKNNRPKKIKLTVYPYNSSKYSMEHILKDSMEMQYIELKEKTLTSDIKIEILSVYKGSKYDDTCISDVIAYTGEMTFN